MKHLSIIVASIVAMLVIISSASAGEPQDVVEHKLGMVVELLYEDGGSDDSAELSDDDRKAEVRKIVYDTFDFEKLSILALSREKKEFSDFQYDRFLNHHNGTSIDILGTQTLVLF